MLTRLYLHQDLKQQKFSIDAEPSDLVRYPSLCPLDAAAIRSTPCHPIGIRAVVSPSYFLGDYKLWQRSGVLLSLLLLIRTLTSNYLDFIFEGQDFRGAGLGSQVAEAYLLR